MSAEGDSAVRRALTGLAIGGVAAVGLSQATATPGQRVAIPAAFGAFLAIILADERDLGVAIVGGAIGASALLSSAEGRPPLEFLPEDLRPGNVRDAFSGRGAARRRRAEMLGRADRLLGR